MSSTSGISFSGLSSGIDTDSIISKLVQLQQTSVTRIQTQQSQIQQKQAAYQQFQTKVSAIAQAANALNTSSAYTTIQAASSDTSVAKITSTSGTTEGSYNLSVTSLARAQKIASASQVDTTSALGLSGSAVINGKAFDVSASDTLTTIAQKVNGLQAGVTASLIQGGSSGSYLTFTATKTGTANQMQIADVAGSVLGSLGVLSGTASVREPVTNGARSFAAASATDPLAKTLGSSSLSAGSFAVNGTSISIDPSTDSLQSLADKVNAAGISGVSATVKTTTTNGATSYNLEITGATTPTFDDPNGLLGAIGVLQQGPAKSLITAQDAKYSLDGINLTSATNDVTDAIPGATLTLLKGTSDTPGTSTISLTRDNSAATSKIQAFADAYNSMVDFVSQTSTFDASTYSSGVLFGDSVVQQVQRSLNSVLFNNVAGAPDGYKNLTQIGFSLDDKGKLQIDSSALSKALTANPNGVSSLFRAQGQGSTTGLSYVSATSDTKATNAGSYAVNITQAATKGSFLAGTAQTNPATSSEKLTFGGSLFGSTPYSLNLDVGSTLDTTVAKINSDAKLKDLVFASNDGGKLRIDSKRYGTGGNFTLASNFASSDSNSGIGVGGEGTAVNGVDVAGTINGEVATGSGQFLTGISKNATTDGLQIQYSGTSTGNVGTISYNRGISGLVSNLVSTFTDRTNGLITSATNSQQTKIDSLQKDIDGMNDRLKKYQDDLKAKFSAMESSMNAYQSQLSQLSSILAQRSS